MKKIRTKLIGTFFSSIFLLAIISLYINFFSSKLSNSVYEMSLSKKAINDVVFYSSSIVNILSFYVSSDVEKQFALKSEYDFSIEQLNIAINNLRSSDQFQKSIIVIQDSRQSFISNAQKIFEASNERALKEKNVSEEMNSLEENYLKIVSVTKNGSQKLKLDIAQMAHSGIEFNFQNQGKEYSDKWTASIMAVDDGLQREGFKSAFAAILNYLDLSKNIIIERGEINDLKLKEQYYMDGIKNVSVEINVASKYISRNIDGQLDILLSQSGNQRNVSWIILIIAFVAGGYVVFLVSQKIADSIDILVFAAKEVSRGNLSQNVDIKSDDELGYLANIFNQMISNISKSQEDLKATEKELELTNIGLENKVKERTVELEDLKNNLERITVERTKELESKVDELERFKDLAVGRELKMIELKKDIERLKNKNA